LFKHRHLSSTPSLSCSGQKMGSDPISQSVVA
jgi:hypothetical protein